jgi:hypothetical protein
MVRERLLDEVELETRQLFLDSFREWLRDEILVWGLSKQEGLDIIIAEQTPTMLARHLMEN